MKLRAGLLTHTAATRFGPNTALTSIGNDRATAPVEHTFAEINSVANQIGSGLARLGIRRGDRVGVLAYNLPEVVATWLGLEKHHLVRVGLHTHLEMDQQVQCLNHVQATALLFDTRFSRQIEAFRQDMTSVRSFVAIGRDAPAWAVPYDEVLADGSAEEPNVAVDEDDPCFLQVTSGTTGSGKPWIKTYRSWHAVVTHNLLHLDTMRPDIPAVGPDDVNLHCHPIQWASGFQTLYPYFIRGARSVLMDDADVSVEQIVDVIVREQVTATFAPASQWKAILAEIERRGGIDHHLRRVVMTFGTPEIIDDTTRLVGPVWANGFGSTEQGAMTTRVVPSDLVANPHRKRSVGRSGSPFFEIAIKDEAGVDVPVRHVGEICVRSPMSLGSYWDLDEESAAARFPEDWLRSSDAGLLDDDGFLYYVGRMADAITTTAGVTYPQAAEAVLERHPAVARCAVVGIGPDGAQVPVAAVRLADGYTPSTALATAIIELTSTELAEHERPERIEFLDDLPTVLGGAKVQRSRLRQQLATP